MPTPPVSRSGLPLLERILLYGGPDSGKSRALLCVAKWHQKRGSDAHFYVVSNDLGYHPLLMPGGEFDELENVTVMEATTMAEHFDAVRKANKKIRPQDWMAVDLLDAVWGAAQDEYAEKTWGVDLAEYWATDKKGSSDDYPVAGWEWGPINKRYRSFAMNEVMRCRGHVMCMSGQRAPKQESKSGKGGEDPTLAAIFKRIAWYPAGQKDDTHRFHTVIHMAPNAKRTEWKATTARERAKTRESMEARPIKDFFLDYLKGIAGWTL